MKSISIFHIFQILIPTFLMVFFSSCDKDENNPTPGKLSPSVSAGDFHSMILNSDSTLWTCGGNFSGELGDGTTAGKKKPQLIGQDFTAISASYGNSLALKGDGTLWAWGDNDLGQLGDGTLEQRLQPVLIGSDFKAISSGLWFSIALKTDGTLWSWGVNIFGQLG